MTFSVLWTPHAESKLTEIWLHTPDQKGVSLAANQIDTQLRFDAANLGESREKKRRIFHVPPIGVIYTVRLPDRVVEVLDVWMFEKPRN